MRGRWVPASMLVAAIVMAAAVTAIVVAVTLWAESCWSWGPAHTCQRQWDQPVERR